MGDIIKELLDAPLSNLIIVAGLAFLAIAVVGKISGKIEPGRGGRILAGVLGSALFVGGLISHMRQHAIPGTQPSGASGAVQKQAETTAAGAAGTEKLPLKHVDTATKDSGAGAPSKPRFRVASVMLVADPPAYKGACPVRVTFTGEIRVTGGAGQVGYEFVNDGGHSSSAQSLQFDSAGSHNVQMSRILGTVGSSGSYAGWEELRILQPQQISSQPAVFHVECTAPTLANQIDIPSLNAKVTALRFYESGHGGTPKELRKYEHRFERSHTQYVNWELGLAFPSPQHRLDFKLDATYYRSNGSILTQQTKATYILPTWQASRHNAGWGWAHPGKWPVDRYQVILRIEGKEVARGWFEVY